MQVLSLLIQVPTLNVVTNAGSSLLIHVPTQAYIVTNAGFSLLIQVPTLNVAFRFLITYTGSCIKCSLLIQVSHYLYRFPH